MLRALALKQQSCPPESVVREVLDTARSRQPALVISDEALSFGRFMLRARNWPFLGSHEEVAERALHYLGDADVLVVLRNQSDWLNSWHRQGLKTGKYRERKFDRWLSTEIGPRVGELFSMLDHERTYDAYANIFGEHKVHVRLYENYRSDLGKLAGEFAQILGVDPLEAEKLMEGKSKNVTGAYYHTHPEVLKRLQRLPLVANCLGLVPAELRSTIGRWMKVRRSYGDLSTESRRKVREHFSDSNRSLIEKLNIDASGLGYF